MVLIDLLLMGGSTDILCVMVAGLIHDLGHGPFSHAFEECMKSAHHLGMTTKKFKHEEASITHFENLIANNEITLGDYLDNPVQDLTFIKELVSPPPRNARKGGRENRDWLYDIVNNTESGMDFDKVDYFKRDSLHCNSGPTPGYEADLMIKDARVCWAKDVSGSMREMICFPAKRAATMMRYAISPRLSQVRNRRKVYAHM